MISKTDINQNLFNLLATKNFDLVTRDNKGKETAEPKEAELFSFDYVVDDHNYGTVVITVTPEGNLEVFYGDALGKGMELDHKSEWYDFLYQLRHFSRRNMLGFELKNMNKLKYAMKTRSQVEESKYYGYKKTSYTKPTKEAKLKIVHSKPIDEEQGDKRYRNISSLYIENAEGERFKLPFTKLFAGRAMARHVSEGGTPHDQFGQHICELVSDIGVLGNFVRASRGKEFTDTATTAMREAGVRHYADLKKKVKRMIGKRGYREQFDQFDPSLDNVHEEITDQLRDMFTETLLDTRIEEAIPVLNKLEARNSVMKELNEFEQWADETTALDLGEGFDPTEFEGKIEKDGKTITYHADVDNEQNRVHVTKCSDEQYRDECQADAEAEWDARDADVPMEDVDLDEGKMKDLMTDIDELTDEEFEEKYKTKKPDYPGINKKMDEGKMKELHLDMTELSDEEFEKKYQSKKSDWDEVKTPGLRQDPNTPAYIGKMKTFAGDLAAEDTEMNEGKFTQEEVQKAIRIAMHMKGDMTDATDAIDAIHPGLTQHPEVQDALKQANESTEEVVAEGPTRKDFQMVADLLKDNPNMDDRKAKAKEYCDKFAKMNPRFDKERFLKACGVSEAIEEDDFEEGNEFSGALAQAKKDGKQEFEVDGKVYKVQEDELKAILRLAR
jgi:hypothetical protein